jgi:PBP1b-binding outer membrane lipoprotein LpoB
LLLLYCCLLAVVLLFSGCRQQHCSNKAATKQPFNKNTTPHKLPKSSKTIQKNILQSLCMYSDISLSRDPIFVSSTEVSGTGWIGRDEEILNPTVKHAKTTVDANSFFKQLKIKTM